MEVHQVRAAAAVGLVEFLAAAAVTWRYATVEWVDRFNDRRLLQPIGGIPPAEAEAYYYAALETEAIAE